MATRHRGELETRRGIGAGEVGRKQPCEWILEDRQAKMSSPRSSEGVFVMVCEAVSAAPAALLAAFMY